MNSKKQDALGEGCVNRFSDRGSIPLASTKLLKNRLISSGFSFFTHEKSTNFHGLFPIQKEKHPVKSGNFQRGQKEENRLSFLRSAGFYRPAFFYLCAVV